MIHLNKCIQAPTKKGALLLWIFMAWLYRLTNVMFCWFYPIKIKTKPTVSPQTYQTSSPARCGAFSSDESSLERWMGQRNLAPSWDG